MTSTPRPLPDGSAVLIDPDPLLAAVPGLLGFTPERSIVLLAFADARTLIATMRHDLTFTPEGRPDTAMRRQLAQLGRIVAGYGTAGVACVIVDDRFAAAEPATEMVRYGASFRAVERSFTAAGGLSAGFVLPEFSAGARWSTGWEPRRRPGRERPPAPFGGAVADSGVLSDPRLSPVALERAVYNGRPVLSRREDLHAALAPRPHCDSAVCRPIVPVVPPAPPGPREADGARLVLSQVREGASGRLECDRVNALGAALCSVHTRDILLALALTDLRDDAEQLWIRLARSLSGRAGAAAATLLGHLHYMAGEGAFASVAVERALELDPDYYLARLLSTALLHGMRPAGLAEVVSYSFTLGRDLGVGLPEQTRAPAG